MAKPNAFTITALSKRHSVFRRFFDEAAFRRTIVRAPEEAGNAPVTHTFNALLPRSAFELEAMHMAEEFKSASQIIVEAHLLLPRSATSRARTIGELKEFSKFAFADVGSSKGYHLYAMEHFGRPYAGLVADLKAALVQRFVAAFDRVQPIHPAHSARTWQAREALPALDCWANRSTVAEMVAIANQGHVYAHWIAALLLTSEKPLTDAAVEHLLAAHEGRFPHALATLAELMLVEGYFAQALETALLALDAGADWADRLIDRITQFTTGMIVIEKGPVRSLMYALVHEVIGPEFHELAMKHRPQWRPPTPEERIQQMYAVLQQRGSLHD